MKLKLLEVEPEHFVRNRNGYKRQKVKPKTKKWSSDGVNRFSLFPNILDTSNFVRMNFDMMHQMASKVFMGEREMKTIDQEVDILMCTSRVSALDGYFKSFIKKYDKHKVSSSNSESFLLNLVEAVVVHEGLTPESEQVFVFHELIDIL
jgi:hypothetical protein